LLEVVGIALMGIIFIPVYINILGIDSYGLIGIYTSLQALSGLLDIGLSNTLNREMARLSGQLAGAGKMPRSGPNPGNYLLI